MSCEPLAGAQPREQQRARPQDACARAVAVDGQRETRRERAEQPRMHPHGHRHQRHSRWRGGSVDAARGACHLQARGRSGERRLPVGGGEFARRELPPRGEIDVRVHGGVVAARPGDRKACRECVRGGWGGGGRARYETCQESDRREGHECPYTPQGSPAMASPRRTPPRGTRARPRGAVGPAPRGARRELPREPCRALLREAHRVYHLSGTVEHGR